MRAKRPRSCCALRCSPPAVPDPRGTMHFTLVISAPEDRDFSFGLVFVPSPVWVQGRRQVLNLTPETPHYQPGGVRRLIEAEALAADLEGDRRHAALIVHPDGNGSAEDLRALQQDLHAEGFSVTTLGYS